MFGRLTISGTQILRILFDSGIILVTPLIILCTVISVSLGLNIYSFLSRFNLQEKALITTQELLTHDILPLLIGLILCGQFSLNLINARLTITRQNHTPEEVILNFVVPIFIGMSSAALLLYIYAFFAFIISLYFTFYSIFSFTVYDYINQMGRYITILELAASLAKTLFYCMIISLTAGYYYYQIAINHVSLRRAVSRIITRGVFWITVGSIGLKYNHLL